jgi:hypothetical protein
MINSFEKDPTLDIIDIIVDGSKESNKRKTEEKNKKSKKGTIKGLKKGSKKEKESQKEKKLRPYREIELSDGHGFYIKTTCNLTSDDQVQVMQYRESPDPDGTKFSCTDPVLFQNKTEFLEWLSQLIINNFDEIPYIKIIPIKEEEIKRKERETTDTMYL